MNIYEAAVAAERTGGLMTRPWGGTEGTWFIKPTDGADCCMMIVNGEKEPCPRWNPQLEDLIAENWEVVNSNDVGLLYLEDCQNIEL